MLDHGRSLDSASVEAGLRDLCPGIHFDMGAKLGLPHPYMADRQGVFYQGRHICSMDRGILPEKKQWTVETVWAPGTMADFDHEDAAVRYRLVHPETPGYEDLVEDARTRRRDDLVVRGDGHLIAIEVWMPRKVPGRVFRVGWRHTFERLIAANIPGITRATLSRRFGVDLTTIPVWTGEPDAVAACMELMAE